MVEGKEEEEDHLPKLRGEEEKEGGMEGTGARLEGAMAQTLGHTHKRFEEERKIVWQRRVRPSPPLLPQ